MCWCLCVASRTNPHAIYRREHIPTNRSYRNLYAEIAKYLMASCAHMKFSVHFIVVRFTSTSVRMCELNRMIHSPHGPLKQTESTESYFFPRFSKFIFWFLPFLSFSDCRFCFRFAIHFPRCSMSVYWDLVATVVALLLPFFIYLFFYFCIYIYICGNLLSYLLK